MKSVTCFVAAILTAAFHGPTWAWAWLGVTALIFTIIEAMEA